MTPEARRVRARLAAVSRIARMSAEDRRQMTAAARQALVAKYERAVDPDGVLSPHDLAQRSQELRRAEMLRLRLRQLTKSVTPARDRATASRFSEN